MHRLRPRGEEELRTILSRAFHSSSELRHVRRLQAVYLVSLGSSCRQIAHWFGEDPRTVARWVHAFDLHGAEGLLEHSRSGRASRLTAQQKVQLAQDTAQDPAAFGYTSAHWSGKLLALHLQRRCGVELSQRQCQRLLLAVRR